MKYVAEKSYFFKFLIIFLDAKNWTGWTWPVDHRRVGGETVAAIYQRWLILALVLSLSILHNDDVFLHIGSSLHAFYILSCWVTDE